MIRDYQIVSPSLDGILEHESLSYEGFSRPSEVSMIFDRLPGSKKSEINSPGKRKIIEQYFNDLYGLLMKKISEFVVASETSSDEGVKLQAVLQELIKVKRLLMGGERAQN